MHKLNECMLNITVFCTIFLLRTNKNKQTWQQQRRWHGTEILSDGDAYTQNAKNLYRYAQVIRSGKRIGESTNGIRSMHYILHIKIY